MSRPTCPSLVAILALVAFHAASCHAAPGSLSPAPSRAATLGSAVTRAGAFARQDIRVPMEEAGPSGLEGLIVYPDDGARHPLVLISHGSPRSAAERPKMTALQFLPEATEFARRGWAAAVVLRRGYGTSGGGWAERWGDCDHPDFLGASHAAVADLRASLAYLGTLAPVDASRTLAVGHSAGAFDTIALTADAPSGLLGAISFAGGRASLSPGKVCGEESLLSAFRTFGATSRTPMLWIYAENDRFFDLAIAERFREAFESGGNKVDFVRAPESGADGHGLFTEAIPTWAPMVDRFLTEHHLVLLADPLPLPPLPAVAPPPSLSDDGKNAFHAFLAAPPHKAFAMSPGGRYGWRSARRTGDEARSDALQNCARDDCRVYMVDDTPMGP